MKKGTIIIKVCILVVICILHGIFLATFEPVFTNEMAMAQMQNYEYSGVGLRAYMYMRNISWVVFVAAILLLFAKEIKFLYTKITKKEGISHEEEK